jgi:hypothetical protein
MQAIREAEHLRASAVATGNRPLAALIGEHIAAQRRDAMRRHP